MWYNYTEKILLVKKGSFLLIGFGASTCFISVSVQTFASGQQQLRLLLHFFPTYFSALWRFHFTFFAQDQQEVSKKAPWAREMPFWTNGIFHWKLIFIPVPETTFWIKFNSSGITHQDLKKHPKYSLTKLSLIQHWNLQILA